MIEEVGSYDMRPPGGWVSLTFAIFLGGCCLQLWSQLLGRTGIVSPWSASDHQKLVSAVDAMG